ncbi:MAG: hypothetical protein ACFFED_10870 [Candidatus Thorarchaeota archaeon]
MTNRPSIRVVYSTKSIGSIRGRTGLESVCHNCDRQLGIVRDFQKIVAIPQEISSLIFCVQLAAEALDVELELVDSSSMSIVQRLKEMVNGKPIPRIEIGEVFLTGFPTKQEIIDMYNTHVKEPIGLRTS